MNWMDNKKVESQENEGVASAVPKGTKPTAQVEELLRRTLQTATEELRGILAGRNTPLQLIERFSVLGRCYRKSASIMRSLNREDVAAEMDVIAAAVEGQPGAVTKLPWRC